MMMTKFRLLILSIIAVPLLSNCSEKQDAFEIAKSHVWGDKVNGCDYQVTTFSENLLKQLNSEKLLNNVNEFNKKNGTSFEMDKVLLSTISGVEVSDHSFTIEFKSTGDKHRYDFNGDDLYYYGSYLSKQDKWRYPKRNGKIMPTDYIICSDNK